MFTRHSVLLITTAALVALVAPNARAQAPTNRLISGTVTNATTHAPIGAAVVTTADRQAVTTADGRFELRVPGGLVSVTFVADGYFPLTTDLDVTAQDVLDGSFALAPSSGFTSTVDVVAASPTTNAPASLAIAPIEVLRTPGGLDNVFRTLQTLPGVSGTDELGSRLAVRGGSPDQNLTVMDGVEIHDPYRLFGLTSAFNPETIRRFDLDTGGFSVSHGDRLSSLLTIENRDGSTQKAITTSAALSVTDANIVTEGRLPGQDKGSWLVSARRTYYDLVASRLTDSDFPRFADVQAKVRYELAPGRSLSFFGLRSRQAALLKLDERSARGEFQDDTRNDVASVRLDQTIGSSAQAHTILAYSNSASTFGANAAVETRSQRSNAPGDDVYGTSNLRFDRTLSGRDISVRQETAWSRGAHLVEAGGELRRFETQLLFAIQGDRNPVAVNGSSVQGGAGLPDLLSSQRTVYRGGLWLSDRWQMAPRVAVEAGVRADRSGAVNDRQLSPRVTLLADLTPGTRFRGAVGRYTQSPGYEKLVSADYVLDLTGPTADRLRSEVAINSSAGLEHDFGASTTVRIESYYKRFSHLLVGQLESDAERQARLARYDFPASLQSSLPTAPIITTIPTNDGAGRAYGFDVFMTRTSVPASARVRGWASYTWGHADRDAYGRRYPFEYDRRHAFSGVGSYRLSEKWEIGSTVRVASGFPRTPPVGLRIAAVADTTDRDRDGNVTELVPAFDSAGRPIYALDFGALDNLNTGHLPVFARVDTRVTWKPRGTRGRWELYLEVINLLNRKNAGSLDPRLRYDPTSDRPRIDEVRDQTIPRLPTLGLRFRL